MTTALANQPCIGTLSLLDAEGAPLDAASVSVTLIGPDTEPTVFDESDAELTNPEPGRWELTFWPSRWGPWWVTGTGLDDEGRPVGSAAACVDVADPPLVTVADAVHFAALAAVEAELGRSCAYTAHAQLTAYSDACGEVELFQRPIRAVNGIVYAGTDDIAPATWTLLTDRIVGLPRHELWTIDYAHGWRASEAPRAIIAVADALALRLSANSDGITQETIGGTTFAYAPGAAALTPAERRALAPYSLLPSVHSVRLR